MSIYLLVDNHLLTMYHQAVHTKEGICFDVISVGSSSAQLSQVAGSHDVVQLQLSRNVFFFHHVQHKSLKSYEMLVILSTSHFNH